MKIKEKLELVREAIEDYDKGVLSDLSTLVAIRLTVNENKISDEVMKRAEKMVKENLQNYE
jgi:hypothetical protein